ncbi:MAG: NAD(P)H-binding protein [Acidimicrobiia bacterium]|nr:NAD(P)H-binding protein [Acidimicrobiia bacterium]
MPVLVIGADTRLGHAIVPALQPASGEIRLFASDPEAVDGYRSFAKVAVGDISDGTHVGGAAIGAFCAIVIVAAAHDERERHFARDAEELFAQWADGLADAGIRRVIVVGSDDELPERVRLDEIGAEYVFVSTSGRDTGAILADVADAEAAERL